LALSLQLQLYCYVMLLHSVEVVSLPCSTTQLQQLIVG